jgi:hypothetical protein
MLVVCYVLIQNCDSNSHWSVMLERYCLEVDTSKDLFALSAAQAFQEDKNAIHIQHEHRPSNQFEAPSLAQASIYLDQNVFPTNGARFKEFIWCVLGYCAACFCLGRSLLRQDRWAACCACPGPTAAIISLTMVLLAQITQHGRLRRSCWPVGLVNTTTSSARLPAAPPAC